MTHPSPSAQKGQATRHSLTTAAAQLIGERGWTAVSTRLVAERAGVRPGIVHYHFPSIRALLTEAATRAIEQTVQATIPALENATPDQIIDALTSSVDAHTGTDAASLLFSETYLAAARDPELRAALSAILARFSALLAERLGDPGAAAVLAAVIDGLILHRALNPGLRAGELRPVLRRLLGGAA